MKLLSRRVCPKLLGRRKRNRTSLRSPHDVDQSAIVLRHELLQVERNRMGIMVDVERSTKTRRKIEEDFVTRCKYINVSIDVLKRTETQEFKFLSRHRRIKKSAVR